MLGASGAVSHVVSTLLAMPQLRRLTLLGRRHVELQRAVSGAAVDQYEVNLDAPDQYAFSSMDTTPPSVRSGSASRPK